MRLSRWQQFVKIKGDQRLVGLDLRSTSDWVVGVEENKHVYHIDGSHRDEIDETVDEHPDISSQ